ncbi:MAG: nicotinate-nucleotide adenylyltransferase [Desulfosalsimonadaceae bacterium]
MKREGLFGGTFNPVHLGHLRTALEVKEGFGLDHIHFIPAATPPHKGKEELASDTDRFAMLTLAIEGAAGFSVSDAEMKRSGRSYTIDTVRDLTQKVSASTQCFLIVGLDAFLEIDTWKDYTALFEAISFIVMSRPDGGEPFGEAAFTGIGDYIKRTVSSGYAFNREENGFFHETLQPVSLFPVTPLGISATAIRRMVKQGRSIRYLVPEPVAAYIFDKRLYA